MDVLKSPQISPDGEWRAVALVSTAIPEYLENPSDEAGRGRKVCAIRPSEYLNTSFDIPILLHTTCAISYYIKKWTCQSTLIVNII
ncbi:MAG: hypothetical protein K2J04_00025 [Lachnospiraceae bacterium]|nr:hypothetical protein [Lachnospiraceae bacterium]